MNKAMQAVKNFWNDEAGVTAIEYGLLAALIAVMIIAGATAIGVNLDTLFTQTIAPARSGSACLDRILHFLSVALQFIAYAAFGSTGRLSQ